MGDNLKRLKRRTPWYGLLAVWWPHVKDFPWDACGLLEQNGPEIHNHVYDNEVFDNPRQSLEHIFCIILK